MITYGFDAEFLTYFGEEGVAAVERAVAMLTNLPPASEINLENYGTHNVLVNHEAVMLDLLDVKSVTLQWLMYQLGLAPASRYVWTIRECTDGSTNVVQRNYDPTTLLPTNLVNDIAYEYRIFTFADGSADAVEFPTDQLAIFPFSAATDVHLSAGRFLTGLTRDDGPGCVRMSWDTNAQRFNSVTSRFDMTFVTNGLTQTQHVQRVVTTPDILFEVRDLGVIATAGQQGNISSHLGC